MVVIVLLNAVDLELTLLALSRGLLFEANPIASYLLSTPTHFIVYKVTLVALGLFLMLVSRRSLMGELAALLVCLVYAMLIYQWTICFSIFQVAYIGGPLH